MKLLTEKGIVQKIIIAIIIVISWIFNVDQVPDFISNYLPWIE